MLSDPLELSGFEIGSELFDHLYRFFYRDFIQSETYLNNSIYINPRRLMRKQGKEIDFWHLTHRDQSFSIKEGKQWVNKKERVYDPDRSARIEWIKQIIVNHNNDKIKFFYHQESNTKRDIRLYLWAHEDDFVVIMQKLGRTDSFLVTCFYIDHNKKRDDYEKRYVNYASGTDRNLNGCEWF
jgi:hypothetical protein